MVIAKLNLAGNRSLLNSDANSVGLWGIFSTKQLSSANVPDIFMASSSWVIILLMVSLVSS